VVTVFAPHSQFEQIQNEAFLRIYCSRKSLQTDPRISGCVYYSNDTRDPVTSRMKIITTTIKA